MYVRSIKIRRRSSCHLWYVVSEILGGGLYGGNGGGVY